MLKITIIALGNKMPSWVNEGVDVYAKRLKEIFQLQLIEVPLLKRNKSSNLTRIMEKECEEIIKQLPYNAYLIALDSQGKRFSSPQLATKLNHLQQSEQHLCLIIGGPEGLHPDILKHCREKWSLSDLTLPHPLVRIVLLEALYRAWAINHNHPYHK